MNLIQSYKDQFWLILNSRKKSKPYYSWHLFLSNWSSKVTTIIILYGTTKLTFEGIYELILNYGTREASSSLLSIEDRRIKTNIGGGDGERSTSRNKCHSKKKDNTFWNFMKSDHFRNLVPKILNKQSQEGDECGNKLQWWWTYMLCQKL